MINADRVAIGHVRGSHQLGRVLHEVITLSNLEQRSLESCLLYCESEVSVEKCVLSF